jgi:putative acetyltransferase
VIIRPETSADHDAIDHVTMQAFASHPHSSQTEHFIIRALRRAGVLSLSLVAIVDDTVVGHVAFSPVTISDGSRDWYILGPVSVLPAMQKKGIGRQLIETGLAQLRHTNAAGCVVLGDPAYYAHFGFAPDANLILAGVPVEYFQALPLGPRQACGQVQYHDAFNAVE